MVVVERRSVPCVQRRRGSTDEHGIGDQPLQPRGGFQDAREVGWRSHVLIVSDTQVAADSAVPSPERSRAVLWRGETITDLGTLDGATGAVANDVNDRGQVIGSSGGRAFVWERGQMRPIGALSSDPAATSRANALARRGLIAGTARTDQQTSHAFLANPRGRGYELRDLGALGGDRAFSTALGSTIAPRSSASRSSTPSRAPTVPSSGSAA